LLKERYYPVMVEVPTGVDGEFEMGSEASDWGHQNDETVHKVRLQAYRIGATEVTFYQYALFSEATGRGLRSRTPYWGRNGNHPVVNVNWYEALEYANWLNVQLGYDPMYELLKEVGSDPDNGVSQDFLKWKVTWSFGKRGYRLPTEAEWELAARAGTRSPRQIFSGGDDIEELGWYWKNSGDKSLSGEWDLNRIYDNNGRSHGVGEKKGNGIGLYDMSGNVWEWCWDWYGSGYYEECKKEGVVSNPLGPKGSKNGRVLRGGSWSSIAEFCRSAYRISYFPDFRYFTLGFRLVFVP
jgi:formylglycine-generating enzyme required for sulfatase activity